ncbi:PEP-CTERM sorting domain-containing protein [Phormidium yuhuli]|uniref:PEP-CTERM sorting domain-containing protein n=1 Tax=Phormidium yuhuli TaxID=2974039 RepID=UPI0035A84819
MRTGNLNNTPGLSNFIVWGRIKDDDHETVPEPAALLGLGAIALASRRLRRKSDDA